MTLTQLDVVALRRWVVTARADLAAQAAALDSLNVFPVPDGDTGTNLLLTMDEALHTLAEQAPTELEPAAQALARATLVAARGNSGVILSQLVRGVAQVVSELNRASLDGADLAVVLRRASELARQGVGTPVEGTMLTVAAAAADGAQQVARRPGAALVEVVDGAIDAASRALLATREQLDVLREAGVVDAGGAGYLLVIEALQRVVHGGPLTAGDAEPEWLVISRQARSAAAGSPEGTVTDAPDPAGPAYEVMFLLADSDAQRASALQSALAPLGDSLIVAGGPELWSVHVHVDDVAAALNAGADAGRPHRFSVTRFADQMASATCRDEQAPKVCRLAVVDGEGFVEMVRREGALVPDVPGGRLPTAQECSMVAIASGAHSAVLLAGSAAAHGVAMDAAEIIERAGRRAVVPRCSHPSEVLAALAVTGPDPALDLESVVMSVDEAVADVQTGRVDLVPHAVRDSDDAVRGLEGDEVVLSGSDAIVAATALLDRMLDGGGELVTVVTGRDAPSDLLDHLVAHARSRPGTDVTAVDGGCCDLVVSIGVE